MGIFPYVKCQVNLHVRGENGCHPLHWYRVNKGQFFLRIPREFTRNLGTVGPLCTQRNWFIWKLRPGVIIILETWTHFFLRSKILRKVWTELFFLPGVFQKIGRPQRWRPWQHRPQRRWRRWRWRRPRRQQCRWQRRRWGQCCEFCWLWFMEP